jgi:energy-coupling factor transport system substrate-specific component
VALNLTLAKVAALLALPVFMDTVGDFVAVALLPLPAALAVGALTSVIGGFVVNPFFYFYVGTQLGVVLTVWACLWFGLMKRWYGAIATGFIAAAVAVLASAAPTVMLFGGVTYGSTTALNAIFIAAGENIWTSVISGSALVESLDKPAAALIAWITLNRLPEHLKAPRAGR